ncbi:MAG: hypothetical protein IKB34_02625 [Clostridia bacterium]|nr:hypothetical protein [Clostridia bacterium]
MRYSLLFSQRGGGSSVDSSLSIREAIYNLNIDRMVNAACPNAGAAEYFLSVLSKPLTQVEDINYRREILTDMLNEPTLLDGMAAVFKGYDNLRAESEEMMGGIFRYGSSQSAAAMIDCAYERAYISAHFARSVIAYLNELDGLLSGYEPSSPGLRRIKSFCAEVSGDPLIADAERSAELFRNETPENYRFRLSLTHDELLRLKRAELSDISQKKKERFNPLGAIKFKKKEEIPTVVDIGTSAAENADAATAYALEELADYYDALANGLYDRLFGMGNELRFYRAALDLHKRIKGAGLPVCFPTVLKPEENRMHSNGICDILLLNEDKDSSSIVPNSAQLRQGVNGILVRGDNNCGKTSFLRSVGTAQLFAQSGLFVCAEEFTASIRHGIFSHFSSAEKEFTDNDAAGRFEGEVKDIASMLKKLRPYSLVLLNETFQTTAYKEGAEGMKLILDALPINGTKYIFVTHMLTVFNLFGENAGNVLMLKTGEDGEKYKLVAFDPKQS